MNNADMSFETLKSQNAAASAAFWSDQTAEFRNTHTENLAALEVNHLLDTLLTAQREARGGRLPTPCELEMDLAIARACFAHVPGVPMVTDFASHYSPWPSHWSYTCETPEMFTMVNALLSWCYDDGEFMPLGVRRIAELTVLFAELGWDWQAAFDKVLPVG